jgi:ribosomal protein L37AE/L43A
MPVTTRERYCCPQCSSVNIVKSKKLYRCRSCNFQFLYPSVKELSVKYQSRIPLLLRKIIETKQEGLLENKNKN